jgi:hypothetical protein
LCNHLYRWKWSRVKRSKFFEWECKFDDINKPLASEWACLTDVLLLIYLWADQACYYMSKAGIYMGWLISLFEYLDSQKVWQLNLAFLLLTSNIYQRISLIKSSRNLPDITHEQI